MNKKEQLLDCFDTAMRFLQEFMGIKIQTPNGLHEIIVFKRENYASKRDYYCNFYNDNLELLANKKVKIVDYCCANDMESIQLELWDE